MKQDNVRMMTESVQCSPLFEIACWAQTYRNHDLRFSDHVSLVIDHVTIQITIICNFLLVVIWT